MYQSMETWPRRRPRRMGRKTKNEFGAALQGFRRFEGRHAGPRRRVTAERSERFAAPAGRSAARAQAAAPAVTRPRRPLPRARRAADRASRRPGARPRPRLRGRPCRPRKSLAGGGRPSDRVRGGRLLSTGRSFEMSRGRLDAEGSTALVQWDHGCHCLDGDVSHRRRTDPKGFCGAARLHRDDDSQTLLQHDPDETKRQNPGTIDCGPSRQTEGRQTAEMWCLGIREKPADSLQFRNTG